MLASVGIVIGWVGALALSRLVASLLYGVEATDLTTYAGVTILLIGIALLAGYFPWIFSPCLHLFGNVVESTT